MKSQASIDRALISLHALTHSIHSSLFLGIENVTEDRLLVKSVCLSVRLSVCLSMARMVITKLFKQKKQRLDSLRPLSLSDVNVS
jgi:hypothetical protein